MYFNSAQNFEKSILTLGQNFQFRAFIICPFLFALFQTLAFALAVVSIVCAALEIFREVAIRARYQKATTTEFTGLFTSISAIILNSLVIYAQRIRQPKFYLPYLIIAVSFPVFHSSFITDLTYYRYKKDFETKSHSQLGHNLKKKNKSSAKRPLSSLIKLPRRLNTSSSLIDNQNNRCSIIQ